MKIENRVENYITIDRELIFNINAWMEIGIAYGEYDGKGIEFRPNSDKFNAILSKIKLLGNNKDIINEHLAKVNLKDKIILVSDLPMHLGECDKGGIFEDTKFEYIDLRGVDSSKVVHMTSLFDSCKAEWIDLSEFNTSKVITMSAMFKRCCAKKLDLSKFDTTNVINMESMFEKIEIDNLDLRSFNTINVRSMGFMFHESKIKNLNISSFNTINVKNMAFMFSKLETDKIDAKNFRTPMLEQATSMFKYTKTDVIDISNMNTINIANMENMFNSCEARAIKFPVFRFPGLFSKERTQVKSMRDAILKHGTNGEITVIGKALLGCKIGELDLSDYSLEDISGKTIGNLS